MSTGYAIPEGWEIVKQPIKAPAGWEVVPEDQTSGYRASEWLRERAAAMARGRKPNVEEGLRKFKEKFPHIQMDVDTISRILEAYRDADLIVGGFGIGEEDAVARFVTPDRREEVEAAVRDLASRKKTRDKRGWFSRTAESFLRGGVEGSRTIRKALPEFMTGPDLDEDQELFRQRLRSAYDTGDPLVPANDPWYKRWSTQAASNVVPMVESIRLGSALGAAGRAAMIPRASHAATGAALTGATAAEAIGAGSRVLDVATRIGQSVGTGGYYLPSMTRDSYYQMREDGVNSKIAAIAAPISGVIQAAIEAIEIDPTGLFAKSAKQHVRRTAARIVGRALSAYGKEWSEEFGQAITDEVAQETAKWVDDKTDRKGYGNALLEGVKQGFKAGGPLLFLVGPGSAVNAGMELGDQYGRGERLKIAREAHPEKQRDRDVQRVDALEEKLATGGTVSREDARAWTRVTGQELPQDQKTRTQTVRDYIKSSREAQNATAVPAGEGVVETPGQVGQGGEVDRVGDVRGPGQDQVPAQPASTVTPPRGTTAEVPAVDVDARRKELESLDPEKLNEEWERVVRPESRIHKDKQSKIQSILDKEENDRLREAEFEADELAAGTLPTTPPTTPPVTPTATKAPEAAAPATTPPASAQKPTTDLATKSEPTKNMGLNPPVAPATSPPVSGVVVAAKGTDGRTYYGKAGETHGDLLKYPAVAESVENKTILSGAPSMGFAGPDGKFLTREEAAQVIPRKSQLEKESGKLDAKSLVATAAPAAAQKPEPAVPTTRQPTAPIDRFFSETTDDELQTVAKRLKLKATDRAGIIKEIQANPRVAKFIEENLPPDGGTQLIDQKPASVRSTKQLQADLETAYVAKPGSVQVTEIPEDDSGWKGWEVKLPGGQVVKSWLPPSSIKVNVKSAAKARNVSEAVVRKWLASGGGAGGATAKRGTVIEFDDGSVYTADDVAVIFDPKGANSRTARHEAWHVAVRLGFTSTKEGKRILESLTKEHGSEEQIADAREAWEGPDGLWEKIKDFVRRVLEPIRRAMGAGMSPELAMAKTFEEGFWAQKKRPEESSFADLPASRRSAVTGPGGPRMQFSPNGVLVQEISPISENAGAKEAIGDAATSIGDIFYQWTKSGRKKPEWAFKYNTIEAAAVNNRMGIELEVFDRLFGIGTVETTTVPGRSAGKPVQRTIANPSQFMERLIEFVKSGEFKKMMTTGTVEEWARKRGHNPNAKTDAKKRDYKNFSEELKQFREAWKLMHEDTVRRKSDIVIIGNNGKAGADVSFGLVTCHPSVNCKECYAAKGVMRLGPIRKHIRNTMFVVADPEAFGKRAAEETKKLHPDKLELPFVRLLGVGDVTTKHQLRAFQAMADNMDRPIHIFSRHHDMLKDLKSRQNAPFIRMASIDGQLYDHYGEDALVENYSHGLVNAYLLASEDDIPKIISLKKRDPRSIGLVLAASVDLHNKLVEAGSKELPEGKLIDAISCPCDAKARHFFASCRACALSRLGCFMSHEHLHIDKEGNTWHVMDENIPRGTTPVNDFIRDKNQMPEAWGNVVQLTLDQSIQYVKNGINNRVKPVKDFYKQRKGKVATDWKNLSPEEKVKWEDKYLKATEEERKQKYDTFMALSENQKVSRTKQKYNKKQQQLEDDSPDLVPWEDLTSDEVDEQVEEYAESISGLLSVALKDIRWSGDKIRVDTLQEAYDYIGKLEGQIQLVQLGGLAVYPTTSIQPTVASREGKMLAGNAVSKAEKEARAASDPRQSLQKETAAYQLSQRITSARTDLGQVPSVFRKMPLKAGTVNVDIGAGKADKGSNFMREHGVTNVPFDPFNRDAEVNKAAMEVIVGPKGDTVTVPNVLNVIAEPEIRKIVITQAGKALKPGGVAYFQIYEGDESGVGKETPKGWQEHRKTATYLAEIGEVFGELKKRGLIIEARSPKPEAIRDPVPWLMSEQGPTLNYQLKPGQRPIDAFMEYLDQLEQEEAQNAPSEKPTQHPEQLADTPSPSRMDLTGIKKAVVNDLRELVGLPEMEDALPETVQGWADKAELTLAFDPRAAERLVNELATNPRPIDQHDAMLLQFHYRHLANLLDPVVNEYFDAVKGGDPAAIATARTAVITARSTMTQFEEIIHPSKSIWGRAGVALQQMLRRDFSHEAILRRGQESNAGKPLSAEQTAELTVMAQKLNDLQSQLDAKAKENEQLKAEIESKKQHAETVEDVKATRARAKTTRLAAAEQKVSDAWAEFKKAASTTAPAGIPIHLVAPAVKLVKAYAELGVVRFGEFMHAVRQNLPDADEKLFRQAWDQVKTEGEIVEPDIDMENLAELTREARRIQRRLVEGGMTDRDQVIDAVHKVMEEFIPGFSRRQTMDALSRYGQFQTQSQEDITKRLREMNAEVLKLAQLDQVERALKRAEELRAGGMSEEDIGNRLEQEGLLVAATGLVRDKPTETVRQLQQQYAELKKSIPAPTQERAGRLQTTQDALIRNLENRIRDVQLEIDNQERIVRDRKTTPENDLIRALRSELEELRKIHREVFPQQRKSLTPEQKLAASERAAQRMLEYMQRQEAAGFPAPAPRAAPPTSAELEQIRQQIEEIRARRDAAQMEGKRVADIDRQIAQLEQRLAANDIAPKAPVTPYTTPMIEARVARRKQLQAELEARQQAEMPELAEARARKAYEASLRKQIANYQQTLANGDFAPKPKREPRILSAEELKLKREMEDVRHAVLEKFAEYHLSHLSGLAWTADKIRETANLSRALMTSFDMSGLLRQGGLVAMGHPLIAQQALTGTITSIANTFDPQKARALGDGLNLENLKTFLTTIDSRQAEFDLMQRLTEGPDGELRQRAGLNLPSSDQKITRQEEAFQGRWGKYVPGVAVSGRLYTMVLNKMRADLFDLMVENLGRGGKVTMEEAKLIASFVNVATGRADLKQLNNHAATLNLGFFAPRYVVSRIQYLAMPFYLPAKVGINKNWRVKRAILKEVARSYAGIGVVVGAFALAGMLFYDDDDDDKPSVELDPRSSDFMKVKLGDTRLDFLAGLQQAVVLSARLGSGQTKNTVTKQIKNIGENNTPTHMGVIGRFLRSKLAPIPGAAVTIGNNWENVVGQKETPLSLATDMFLPMSMSDVWKTMQMNGLPKGTALSLLSILGVGMNTYGPKTEYVTGTEEQRQKQLEKDLDLMQWNSPPPAYSEYLTQAQIKQIDDRREEKKASVVFDATAAAPERARHKSDQTFQQTVKQYDSDLSRFREMSLQVDHSEAQRLLVEHYRAPGKFEYERGKLKKEYVARGQTLAKLYGLSAQDFYSWYASFANAH